ncbi:MAG: hypothetical protein LBF72_02660 [Holosporales bacterium]|nr:hypothetical protein [Holosporales bacterium]
MLVNNGIADVVEGGPVDFRGLLGEDDGSVFEPLGFPGEEFDVEDKLEAIVETPGAEDA